METLLAATQSLKPAPREGIMKSTVHCLQVWKRRKRITAYWIQAKLQLPPNAGIRLLHLWQLQQSEIWNLKNRSCHYKQCENLPLGEARGLQVQGDDRVWMKE
jgi:hypothetical protein